MVYRRFSHFPGVFGASQDTDWYYPAHPWHAVVELPWSPEGEPVVIAEGEPLLAGIVGNSMDWKPRYHQHEPWIPWQESNTGK